MCAYYAYVYVYVIVRRNDEDPSILRIDTFMISFGEKTQKSLLFKMVQRARIESYMHACNVNEIIGKRE